MATNPRVAIVVALLVGTRVAHGDVQPDTAPGLTDVIAAPAPPPIGPKFQVSVHGALRSTVLDSDGGDWRADALEYGWRSAIARPLLGFSIDASYLHTPIIDVGASLSWMGGSFAAGLEPSDRLRARTASVAVTGRLHWAQGRAFVPEPRVDVGAISERLTVHGVPDEQLRWFVRAGIDWRLGNRTAGVELQIAYTMVERDDAMLSPPIGGLDLAAGPYFRF